MNEKDILEKIEKGTPLTDDEEFFYMTKILGYSVDEANRIIAIADNEDPNVIID